MYKRFFDLRERPFKLVPNPAYLFLSKGHEEALAHLSYALTEGDGFVAIIGEVGTGKTLLCRTFLDSLGDDVEAAYVFNPRLDGRELLRAINGELGVDATGATTQELIDGLNRFLIDQHQAGRRVLVLIDEAQNLSAEVLEQLRLLSNLETRDAKLVQIILVGQPELAELLDSHALRQLAQRITLSCYLAPLSRDESDRYIAHRLAVASQGRSVPFMRSALRALHRFSGGVPRRINIACDRALLAAYVAGSRRVTGRIARQAVAEVAEGGHARPRPAWTIAARAGAVAAVAVAAAVGVARYPGVPWPRAPHTATVGEPRAETVPPAGPAAVGPVAAEAGLSPPASVPAGAEAAPGATESLGGSPAGAAAVAGAEAAPGAAESLGGSPAGVAAVAGVEAAPSAADPRPPLGTILGATTPRASRVAALRVLLAAWGESATAPTGFNSKADDGDYFRDAAAAAHLELRRVDADLALLTHLDLPVVLEFRLEDNPRPRYLTMVRVDGELLTLTTGLGGDGAGEVVVSPEALNWYWTGSAYLAWRDFLGIGTTVPLGGGAEAVRKVKQLLAAAGLPVANPIAEYDDFTRTLVEQIQASHGLEPDGVVGALTKVCLYNASPGLRIPHLCARAEATR